MLKLIIFYGICIFLPCLILNYAALKDARQKGIIAVTQNSGFIGVFQNMLWIIFFEIGKVLSIGAILLVSYLLVLIVRGPLESSSYSGGGFLGGTTTHTYMNNTFGHLFLMAIPFVLVFLLGRLMIDKLALHKSLFITLLIYFFPAYLAFVGIMMWEW